MSFVISAVAVAVELGTAAAIASAVAQVGIAMTVVGTVTKSKELVGMGGVLSMAGGIGSLAAGAMGAISGAAAGEGALGSGSLWADAASEATADASANMAMEGVEQMTADSFAGAAAADAGANLATQASSAMSGLEGAQALAGDAASTGAADSLAASGADGANRAVKGIDLTQAATDQASTPAVTGAAPAAPGSTQAAIHPDILAGDPMATGESVPQKSAWESVADWYKKLKPEEQSRVGTAVLQAGGAAVGGIFNGWSESQKMDLAKEIQAQKTANGSAVPTIAFKPQPVKGLVAGALQGVK